MGYYKVVICADEMMLLPLHTNFFFIYSIKRFTLLLHYREQKRRVFILVAFQRKNVSRNDKSSSQYKSRLSFAAAAAFLLYFKKGDDNHCLFLSIMHFMYSFFSLVMSDDAMMRNVMNINSQFIFGLELQLHHCCNL